MNPKKAILQTSAAAVLTFSLFGLAFQPRTAYAEDIQAGSWAHVKSIEIQGDAPYYELVLDEDVYRSAAGNLADLRIVDAQGNGVPFYRDSGTMSAEEHNRTYSSELVHTAVKAGDTLFDYAITPVQQNADIVGNRLVFALPEGSFLKHVRLFGSYDGNVWDELQQAELYSADGRERNSIELGSAYKYGYYRLLVENNAEKLVFDGLELVYDSREVKTTDYKREISPSYEIEQEGSNTRITVSNANKMKIAKVLLDSSGNFNRTYSVQEEDGTPIAVEGGGELYRLDFQDVKITATDIVPSGTLAAPSFTILINNRDDAPVSINGIRLEVLVDKLVFPAPAEGQVPYQLLYGNAEASAPQYDLINFKEHIESGTVGSASLGAEQAAPQSGTEEGAGSKWLQSKPMFNGVIVGVSLLLIVVLVRRLNRR